MYDHNSISFEVRERARSRERDGENERIARDARRSARRERRSILTDVVRRLRHTGRRRLVGRNYI